MGWARGKGERLCRPKHLCRNLESDSDGTHGFPCGLACAALQFPDGLPTHTRGVGKLLDGEVSGFAKLSQTGSERLRVNSHQLHPDLSQHTSFHGRRSGAPIASQQ